jgi:hypothetical protein
MKTGRVFKPALLAIVLISSAVYPALARSKDSEETCCQPGRIESAKAIIAQAESFKMKATQFHTDSAGLIRDAVKLRGQAASIDPNARKTYEADLASFTEHANAYRAHQAEVERTIGFCKTAQAEYEQMLAQFTLHTQMFHQQNLPNVKPPHVCHEMGLSNAEAQKLNNQMRVDAERVANSEVELADAENKLNVAAARNSTADAPLAARSKVLDAERQLTGEFAALKTEYDLLSNEHKALTATGVLKDHPVISKVSGKVKTK